MKLNHSRLTGQSCPRFDVTNHKCVEASLKCREQHSIAIHQTVWEEERNLSDSESMQQRFFGHDKYDKCCKTLNFEYYGRKLRQNDWTIPTSNHAKFAPVILLGWDFFFFRWVRRGRKAQSGYWKASLSDTLLHKRWILATRFRSNAPSSSCQCFVVVHDKVVYWHVMMSKMNHWTLGISNLSGMLVRNRLSVGGVGNRPLSFYTPLLTVWVLRKLPKILRSDDFSL